MLYIELDKPEPVIDELLPLLSHKLPKIIAATLAAFTAIYHAYGCKTADPKPVLKSLPKVFGHADKNVRAEAQNLTVEFYRWLREGMKPLFWNDLKPVQQGDLEKLFDKVKDEPPPKPERLLRSQQAAQATAAPSAGGDGGTEEEEDEEPADFEPEVMAVDVFSKIPKDFSERLGSSKWKDRKEALDNLHTAINFPAIDEGPFDEIARGLAKCMKDANIAVVTVAANCVERLAKGLRRGFTKYRSTVFTPIMERLKERKQSVTDALAGALDAVCISTSLSECLEEVLGYLTNKNPQIKLGATQFLTRNLKSTREAPSIPEVKLIADASNKLLTDSQETQRNAACEVLGVLLKVMGDRVMNVHLNDLDEIRKAKVKEFADAAEVKAKYKPKQATPAPKAAPAATQKKPVAKKPTAAASKKAAPAAATPPMEEAAPTPLQPKPTARTGIARPGANTNAPRGLKPPSSGAPAARRLPAPGGAASPAPPSRTAVASPPPEEVVAVPKISRGLAGRTLTKPAPAEPAPPTSTPDQAPQSLPSLERIELDELRAEVGRLRNSNETLRADHLKLNSRVQELENQNAQLIEDHTRDTLSIKAKETQLVRARSDAETAEQQSSLLQREVERLKRELGRMGRAASPRTSDYTSARDIFPSEDISSTGTLKGLGGPGSRHAVVSPTFSAGKENAAPDAPVNGKPLKRAESKGSSERSANASPRRAGISGRPLSQPPPPYNTYNTSANGHKVSHGSSTSGAGHPVSESEARSSATSATSLGGRESGGNADRAPTRKVASTGAEGGVESWKRAAEVTQNLKARIELMKARQQQQGLNRR